MGEQLNGFLDEFAAIGPAYCANLKQNVDDTERRKVVDIYDKGLSSVMRSTAEILRTHVDGLPTSQQDEIDRFIGASGGRELLAAANSTLTTERLGTMDALSSIPGIIELAKKIIVNFIPLPAGPDKLLEKIDLILDLIGKFFGLFDGGPKQEEKPAAAKTTVRLLDDETRTVRFNRRVTSVRASDPRVAAATVPADDPNGVSIVGLEPGGRTDVVVTFEDGSTETIQVEVQPRP